MIGSIVGGALKLGSSIFGGIKSSRANRKANQLIADQKAKNQAWYDRNYNANYTQRSDAQELLGKTRDFLSERYGRSAATNTVMGGTDEALAMEKEAANQALSETIAGIDAQASAHKDQIEQAYLNQDANLTQQQVAIQQGKAANISQAASGASQNAAGIVGQIFDKK